MFLTMSRSVLLSMRAYQSNIENKNINFMFNYFFFRKLCRLWDNVEKYCIATQATDDYMEQAHLHAVYLRLQTHTQNM